MLVIFWKDFGNIITDNITTCCVYSISTLQKYYFHLLTLQVADSHLLCVLVCPRFRFCAEATLVKFNPPCNCRQSQRVRISSKVSELVVCSIQKKGLSQTPFISYSGSIVCHVYEDSTTHLSKFPLPPSYLKSHDTWTNLYDDPSQH